jgi:hypothetical protein
MGANRLKLLVFLMLSCCKPEPAAEKKRDDCEKEQQRYYDRIPDAPIDLYAYVDNLLDTDDRFEICTKIYNRNLTAELGISIKDNKVDTVEMLTFYFDENDRLQKDTSDYSELHKILNAIDKQSIPTFKFEKDGDFALRLQWRDFASVM